MTTSESQAFSTIAVGSNRSFGVVFVFVFALIGLYPLLAGASSVRVWALVIAGLFLIPTLIRPALLQPLNVAWFKFGMLLGRIINPVVMFLIYAVAVVPTGLLLHLFRKDVLRLRLDGKARSYWISREPPGPEPRSLEDQF